VDTGQAAAELAAPELPPLPRPKVQLELENFIALTSELARGELVWESRPWFLEYSTNSACNLRCIMCSQVEDPPVVSTPHEELGPFFEQVLRHTTVLTPSATSEPLLNNMKRLGPYLEHYGVELDIITNAMLLTPEVTDSLIPRLAKLTLSIDSQEKAIFEKLRAPAVFETVIEHSRYAFEACRKAGVPVIVHMVLAHECLPHLEGFVDFIADLGGTNITVLELLHNSPNFDALDPFQRDGEEAVAARLEAMRARAEERGIGLLLEVHGELGGAYPYGSPATRITSGTMLDVMHQELAVRYAGFCPHVMGYFKVEPDGRAFPCCRAPEELELGNVFEEGVEAVWNGPAMQELRRRMFAGDLPEPCVGCNVPDPARWKAAERAAEKAAQQDGA
jgi:radical SAM protein with 4Fe4S-binding SPASM domain